MPFQKMLAFGLLARDGGDSDGFEGDTLIASTIKEDNSLRAMIYFPELINKKCVCIFFPAGDWRGWS